MYILKILHFNTFLFLFFRTKSKSFPSHRTSGSLVTLYDCEENEQKTLHIYAINQVTQCESKPQAKDTTNLIALLYSKARATTKESTLFTSFKRK